MGYNHGLFFLLFLVFSMCCMFFVQASLRLGVLNRIPLINHMRSIHMLQSVCSCENLATFSLFRVLWDIITGSCFTHHVLICVDTFLSLSSSEFFLGVLERMPLINPLLRSIKFCNPLSLQELMYIFIVLGFVGGIIIGCSFTYQVLRCVDMW